MKITNVIEQQDYIRQQTQKLQKLSDIGHYLNSIIYNETTNIISALIYDDPNIVYAEKFFETIEEYKILLKEFES